MKQINHYIDSVFYKEDALLEEVLSSIVDNGMRSISVSPSTGKLLTMLVSISGAKNVLEIGALGGYSGICLARGFGSDGKLTSLDWWKAMQSWPIGIWKKRGLAGRCRI